MIRPLGSPKRARVLLGDLIFEITYYGEEKDDPPFLPAAVHLVHEEKVVGPDLMAFMETAFFPFSDEEAISVVGALLLELREVLNKEQFVHH